MEVQSFLCAGSLDSHGRAALRREQRSTMTRGGPSAHGPRHAARANPAGAPIEVRSIAADMQAGGPAGGLSGSCCGDLRDPGSRMGV
jgi:hypothetical protein